MYVTMHCTQPIKLQFPLFLVTVLTNKLGILTILFLQCGYCFYQGLFEFWLLNISVGGAGSDANLTYYRIPVIVLLQRLIKAFSIKKKRCQNPKHIQARSGWH